LVSGNLGREEDAMLNIEAKTRLDPHEATARVKAFFGPGGEGLKIDQEAEGCLSFCGPVGYVTASIYQNDRQTVVNLLTQEFEYQVKRFMDELP
jgi:hypothetical protein